LLVAKIGNGWEVPCVAYILRSEARRDGKWSPLVRAMSSESRPAAARHAATAAARRRQWVGIVIVWLLASACAAPPAASVPLSSPAVPGRSESHSAEPTASSMTPAHVTTVIAGTGTIGRSGDGGPGVAAEIEYPVGITISEGAVLF